MVKEAYAQQFWQDYVADTLGAIQFGLSHIGGTNDTPVLYSDIAHESRIKQNNLTAGQIIGNIVDRL